MLVGNKSDQEDKRVVSYEEGEALGIAMYLYKIIKSQTVEIIIHGNFGQELIEYWDFLSYDREKRPWTNSVHEQQERSEGQFEIRPDPSD